MTRQQKWAMGAHQQVIRWKESPKNKEFKTLGMKMPNLIHQSGLIQTLVFYQTRGEAGREFIQSLASILEEKNGEELVRKVQSSDLQAYMALTHQIVSIAEWIRRFIQIEMKDIQTEEW